MYFGVNMCSSIVCFGLLVLSGDLLLSCRWLLQHEGAVTTLACVCLLSSGAQLFVYKMVKEYRQHVPAFVLATRKCLTVLLSFFWYHHSLASMQVCGIVLVFMSIMVEVYTSYLGQLKKGGELIPTTE